MKSMTKLIVVAMILAAALVVTPVAARGVTSGNNVFVGEENVILNTAAGGDFDSTTQLVHYTGTVGASSIDKTLTVNAAGKVEILEKGIPTGSYYARSVVPAVDLASYVNVQNPEVTLDAVLDDGAWKDSVNGKTVTRDTKLAFKIRSNVDTYDAVTGDVSDNVSIEVTLPGGGVVTSFGGQTLTYNADGSTQYIRPIDLSNAAAGTYTAVGKWIRASDFFGKGFDSKPVTFEVLTKSLGITANKDSVVRGNSFSVTVTGESRTDYQLFVKSGSNNAPLIARGQTAVNYTTDPGESDWNRTIKTNAGGTATIQFNTNATDDAFRTEDKTYTIRVEGPAPGSAKNDEVKVKVEAGSVTITTSGTGTYYIGEEVTLSGTSTEGNTIYLFMTGPNLKSDGVNLTSLGVVNNGQVGTFDTANVNADDTWSHKWDTAALITGGKSIDAGGYTIYAVSTPSNKGDLSGKKYATASVNLRSGFITATTSGATVARGDKLTISGAAQGNPTSVYTWIFGKNYYGAPSELFVRSTSVESDGSFEENLESGDTESLAAGQYFVVVQHPMGASATAPPGSASAGSIIYNTAAGTIEGGGQGAVTITGLQAPAAASALINLLDSANIPDTYVKLTFVVAEPNLFIDPIGTKTAGSKFTITGTTNLAVGDTLNIDVTSAAFQPGSKTEASGFSSSSGNAVVQKGDGANKWSFEVDATSFKPDQYIVKVESIEADTVATATFNVVAGGEPTTPPEGNVTTTTTTATTTTATTTTAATPTTTPGFGALVALAGLGAVAFLVLRRK